MSYNVNHEYYYYAPVVRYFTNPVHGNNMAIAGTDYDLTENVYDGGDNVYWTLSVQNSPSDFVVSDDHNHTAGGTYSLSFSPSEAQDYAHFTRGSSLALTNYIAVHLSIYLTSFGLDSNLALSAWNSTTQVGTSVLLKPYISTGQLNAWQNVSVPLSALGIDGDTIDALRITINGEDTAPNGYLDDIHLVGSTTETTPTVFTIEPNEGEDLVIETLQYIFCDSVDVTGATGWYVNGDPTAFITIPALSHGLEFKRYSGGTLLFTNIWHTTVELLCSPASKITNVVSNGTRSLVTVEFTYPDGGTLLRSRYNDKIEITITDDLTGFDEFKVITGGKLRIPHPEAQVYK